ncbi:MAG TPA: hypothetical protein IGS53_11265 [Leptolyngbyaceae cyanobacterium M33_DOE_097]|uniref:Uncharacterized protein n=1 Tax=Oscillatoriales cyanobacterium SpSt-418 TaxID=2282169 RepID=A0A7C3PHB7_9CYAN|nr:hypothetical protein [Leptolyngbyaceae cyanobacterium M33_DOE_097]
MSNLGFTGRPDQVLKAAAAAGTATAAAISSSGGVGAALAAVGTVLGTTATAIVTSPALPFVVAAGAVYLVAKEVAKEEEKDKE